MQLQEGIYHPWYNAAMDATGVTKGELIAAIDELVERYRGMCLWFAPKGYLPGTDLERLRALENIERYGDREAFVKARELRDWLLLRSKNE